MTDERDEFLELAAQCWCDPKVSDRVMDVELAKVFATAQRQLSEKYEAKLKSQEGMMERMAKALKVVMEDYNYGGVSRKERDDHTGIMSDSYIKVKQAIQDYENHRKGGV